MARQLTRTADSGSPRVDLVIDADVEPITKNTAKATAAIRGLHTSIGQYLGAAAMATAGRAVLNYAGALSDLSAKAGVTVEWLQAAGYAARLSGSSMEQVADTMVHLRQSIAQAAQGSAPDIKAFKDLNLSVQDLKSLAPEQVFKRIAEQVERTNGGLKVTNATIGVLGRGGKGLLPAMMGGWGATMDQYLGSGRGLSAKEIAALDLTGDRLDDAQERFTVAGAKGAAAIVNPNTGETSVDGLVRAWNILSPLAWFSAATSEIPPATGRPPRNWKQGRARLGRIWEAIKRGLSRHEADNISGGKVVGEDLLDRWNENEAAAEAESSRRAEARRRLLSALDAAQQNAGARTAITSDALSRIGLFAAAGSGGPAMQAVQRIPAQLEAIKASVDRVAAVTQEGGL